MRKNRKAATKRIALSILEETETAEPAEIPKNEEIIEIKPRKENSQSSKLAELAERIRLNIDNEAEVDSKPV